MREIALHILDIARNSIEAGATRLLITVIEDERADGLTIEIVDNGRGMAEEELRHATDPFYTTRQTRRFGLGLSLLEATCQRCGGEMHLRSIDGHGTHVTASLQWSHLDRPPMGDMGASISALAAGAAQVQLTYRHGVNGQWLTIDTNALQYELDDVGLRTPTVLQWLTRHVNAQLREMRAATQEPGAAK